MNAFRLLFKVLSGIFPRLALFVARKLMMTPRLAKQPKARPSKLPTPRERKLSTGGALYSWEQHGPVAVFLHGWDGKYTQFAQLTEILYERGWAVHSIAAPGHFGTERQQSSPVAFLDSLQEVQSLVKNFDLLAGHSMGAGIAGIMSLENAHIKKLVLIAAPSNFDGVIERFCRFIGMPQRLEEPYKKYITEYTNTPLNELSLLHTNQRILADTMVIHDRNDREIPFNECEKIKRQHKHLELVVTEGLGHKRILKCSNIHNVIADFASGLYDKSIS